MNLPPGEVNFRLTGIFYGLQKVNSSEYMWKSTYKSN